MQSPSPGRQRFLLALPAFVALSLVGSLAFSIPYTLYCLGRAPKSPR